MMGNNSVLRHIADFFTGKWIVPIDATAKEGIRVLKSRGFSDKQITKLRDMLRQNIIDVMMKRKNTNFINKDYRKVKDGEEKENSFALYDDNFTGLMVPIGMGLSSKELKVVEKEMKKELAREKLFK